MRYLLLFLFIVCAPTAYAQGIDLNKLNSDSQNTFDAIAKDIAATIAFVDPVAGQSSAVFSVDAGLAVSVVPSQATDELKTVGYDVSTLYAPRLYGGLSVASFSSLVTYTPLFSAFMAGVKLGYDVFGGVVFPKITAVAYYNGLHGIKTMKANSFALGVNVSKSLALFTIYGHVAYEQTKVEELGSQIAFNPYKKSSARFGLGARVSLGIMELGAQALHTHDHAVMTISIGI